MKTILRVLCGLALALSIVPAWLNYHGTVGETTLKSLMLLGTVLWFAAATLLDTMKGDRTKH